MVLCTTRVSLPLPLTLFGNALIDTPKGVPHEYPRAFLTNQGDKRTIAGVTFTESAENG